MSHEKNKLAPQGQPRFSARRRALSLGAGGAALLSGFGALAADDRQRPISLVVGYGPGSTFDNVARAVAELAAAELKQPVVIDNRAGAGGTIGNIHAARAAADGRTVLLGGAGTHAVTAAVKTDLPYDTEKDFVALSALASLPMVMVVASNAPYKTFDEFLDYARKHPGEVNYGTAGLGTSNHLSGELLKARTGIQMTHIAYKSNNTIKTDLLAGRIHLSFEALPAAMGLIDQGSFRAIAALGTKRAERLPDVPTVSEMGVKDFAVDSWIGVFAPTGIPANERERIGQAFGRAAASPEGRKRLLALGAEPLNLDAEAFTRLWLGDLNRWKRFIAESGLKVSD